MRESFLTTLVWVALAIGFGFWLASRIGWEKGSEFFTGYVIEYSLSMDNLFLFVLIFANFRVARTSSGGSSFGASSARWSCAAR